MTRRELRELAAARAAAAQGGQAQGGQAQGGEGQGPTAAPDAASAAAQEGHGQGPTAAPTPSAPARPSFDAARRAEPRTDRPFVPSAPSRNDQRADQQVAAPPRGDQPTTPPSSASPF